MNCGGPVPAGQTILTRQAPQETNEHAMDTVINSTKERLQRGELSASEAIAALQALK